jgi:hypothetical protein
LGDQGGDAALPSTSRERRDFSLSGGLVYPGIREICEERAPETGNSLHRGPVEQPGGVFVYRGIRETVKGYSINTASLSLCMGALSEELGWLLYWEI